MLVIFASANALALRVASDASHPVVAVAFLTARVLLPPIVSVDLIKSLVSGKDEVDEAEFDLDEILEKISITGIESLTDKEKEFLDNKSKEM